MAFVNALLTASENGNQHKPVPLHIQEFAEMCDFSVIQINGQRYSTPKTTYYTLERTLYVPPRGSEVYIGNIPHDCLEPDLLPLFQQIGPVFKFRLMMNFSGFNRGFAFVQFLSEETASLVVERLNNYEIRPGFQLRLKISLDSNRLLLTGVPKYKTSMELFYEVLPLSPGLLYVTIERDEDIPKFCPPDRAFASLVFEDHRTAAIARSRMLAEPQPLQLWGYPIQVDWAEPIALPAHREQHVLEVTNLNKNTSTAEVKRVFNETSNNGIRKTLRRSRSSKAVIYFKTRAQAEMAKEANQETTIEGRAITVDWFVHRRLRSSDSNSGLPNNEVFNPIQPIPAPGIPAGIPIFDCQSGFWTYVGCTDPNYTYFNQPQPLPLLPFQGAPFLPIG